MKHNVGDKVKVHSLAWLGENFIKNDKGDYECDPNSFVWGMQKFCEKIVTISKIIGKSYFIEDDNNFWNWEDWMFEEDEMKEETNWEHYQKEIEKFIANGTPCDKCPASKYCDTVQKCGEIFCHWANSKYVPEEPVAPKPAYRAWTKDTFPLHVGAEVRQKGGEAVVGVTSYHKNREKVWVDYDLTDMTFSHLFANYEMADGTPCGELIVGEETK